MLSQNTAKKTKKTPMKKYTDEELVQMKPEELINIIKSRQDKPNTYQKKTMVNYGEANDALTLEDLSVFGKPHNEWANYLK